VASAEADVAAIERRGVLAASLLLPGLAAVTAVRAEEPPEGLIAFKYGAYRDGQPGWDRIKVNSPQLYVLAPFANVWSIEGSVVSDSVSGATPRMHTSRTGATPAMSDHRSAEDVKVTRYFHRAAISVGTAYSGENDYISHAQSIEARWSSEDNNRTFLFGFGHAGDRIDNTGSEGGIVQDQHRQTREWMAGVTQVVTPNDIVQVQLTRSLGRGFYSDPYKDFDERPNARRSTATLLRWNHHVEPRDATLRTSWRYYSDSFGIHAHTLSAEWVQPYGAWTITPGARYHVQSAAWFYVDPVADAHGVPDQLATQLRFGSIEGYHSADQRLAAFGAVTLSLKVACEFANGTTADVKLETYRQSSHLKPGAGSPYLDPFRASFVQLGVSHKF
jgi:hypothetical protein